MQILRLHHVVPTRSSGWKVKYRFYLWPYGSGALFKHKTIDIIGNVCQHGFELEDSKQGKGFMQDLACAWKEGARRLEIQETVDFDDEEEDDDE